MYELWKYRILFIIGILVMFITDQASKIWAIQYLSAKMNMSFQIIPDYFEFKLIFNRGGAWGIFSNYTQGLAVMSTVMIIVILTVLGKTSLKDRLLGWALTFQLGGALGNLYDRVLRPDGVVDFLHAYIPWGGGTGGIWYKLFGTIGFKSGQDYVARIGPLYDWPVFNLADVYVVIGTILLLIYILRMPPEPKVKKVTQPTVNASDSNIPITESAGLTTDISNQSQIENLEFVGNTGDGESSLNPPVAEGDVKNDVTSRGPE